jgi:hypothetical protein
VWMQRADLCVLLAIHAELYAAQRLLTASAI